ncbi:hypothetical protein P0M04_30285 [Telluria mixta]|nr:hypothetical protein [Telluria mixta]WEM95710.1 hypothetical protein P0M04_30285 [Telluria mixta]
MKAVTTVSRLRTSWRVPAKPAQRPPSARRAAGSSSVNRNSR